MMLSKVIFYSVSKYIELGLSAVVLLHFAGLVGAEGFSEVAPALLAVTYSAFLVMGINGAYVKVYSKTSSSLIMKRLSTYCISFNVLIAGLAFILVNALLDNVSSILVAGICALNLIKGGIQSVLRATLKTSELAILNFLYATVYLIGYLFLLQKLSGVGADTLFTSWLFAQSIGVFWGVSILFRLNLLTSPYKATFVRFARLRSKVMFSNGVKLAALTLTSILFTSSDRFLLIQFDFDQALIGGYQFADSFSNIFYMGSSALLYLLTPFYTRQLHEGKISRSYFTMKSLLIGGGWFFVVGLFVLTAYLACLWYFTDYQQYVAVIALLSLVKYLMLLMFIPSTIYMTWNVELNLLKYQLVALVLHLGVQVYLCIYHSDSVDIYLPLVSVFSITFVLIYSLFNAQKQISMTAIDRSYGATNK